MNDALNLIGFKRFIVLLVVTAVCGVIFSLQYMFFAPQLSSVESKLNGVKGEVSKLQRNLTAVQQDFDKLGGQKEIFERMAARDMFSFEASQDSTEALAALEEEAGVRVDMAVVPAPDVTLEVVEDAGHEIIAREVVMEISAFDDGDIYKYLTLLRERAPGYFKMKSAHIRQNMPVNNDTLKAIFTGDYPDIVHATFLFDWYFIVPKPEEEAPQPSRGQR